jgi:electron transfer flavoprotein-quinone oxidoreductase
MADKYQVIVVGAGLAGSAAAFKLAQAGLEVVLIERGQYPGSKNLSGGILYGGILNELIPAFWEEAPVERNITRNIVTFLTEEDSFSIETHNNRFSTPPYNGFSVLRGKFDRWLAEKAEEEGAMLVPGICIDGLVKENGKVIGVKADDEEMLADVVIAADGVNSFLAREAGLYKDLRKQDVAVGIKELIELPAGTIEDRFNLTGKEGTAYGIIGYATAGQAGGAFLYTNKESISVGLVIHLDDLLKEKRKAYDILEDFLEHPRIAPLVRGGKATEYGAHLIQEAGYDNLSRLYDDHLLVVGEAAGLLANNGLVIRGMDLAIGSGMLAAEAVLQAFDRNNFSADALSSYQKAMEQSFILKDMKTYSKAPGFMKGHRLYQQYPDMVTGLMEKIYAQDCSPKENIYKIALNQMKESQISLLNLAGDGRKGLFWL